MFSNIGFAHIRRNLEGLRRDRPLATMRLLGHVMSPLIDDDGAHGTQKHSSENGVQWRWAMGHDVSDRSTSPCPPTAGNSHNLGREHG
jgi:hypothetical protein